MAAAGPKSPLLASMYATMTQATHGVGYTIPLGQHLTDTTLVIRRLLRLVLRTADTSSLIFWVSLRGFTRHLTVARWHRAVERFFRPSSGDSASSDGAVGVGEIARCRLGEGGCS